MGKYYSQRRGVEVVFSEETGPEDPWFSKRGIGQKFPGETGTFYRGDTAGTLIFCPSEQPKSIKITANTENSLALFTKMLDKTLEVTRSIRNSLPKPSIRWQRLLDYRAIKAGI